MADKVWNNAASFTLASQNSNYQFGSNQFYIYFIDFQQIVE